MAASQSTKLQVNLKANDALINVYGDNAEDLESGLTAIGDNAGNIASADSLLKAAFNVMSPVNTATAPGYQTAAQAAPAAAASPTAGVGPAGAAPSCQHGTRGWVTGNGSKGPWSGWFCALPKDAPKEAKCSPEWIK